MPLLTPENGQVPLMTLGRALARVNPHDAGESPTLNEVYGERDRQG